MPAETECLPGLRTNRMALATASGTAGQTQSNYRECLALYLERWGLAIGGLRSRNLAWREPATGISSWAIMAEIDTAAEWRRLQELYREMSEDELEAVAKKGYELTDIAKQVLHSEILHRQLKVDVRLQPPMDEEPEQFGDPEFDPATLDLVSALAVENRFEAEFVKTTLNHAGIPCYFGPELLENPGTLEFLPKHTVQVKVLKHDLFRVRWALKGFRELLPSPEDDQPPDLEVRCPKCRSNEVVFEGFDSRAAERNDNTDEGDDLDEDEDSEEEPQAVEEVRAADPHAKFHWRCDHCGHEWEDEGVES